jgi:TPR repeat protein
MSAARGYVSSQVMLGLMYMKGIGVLKDKARAKQWLEKAAKQGHPIAMKNLKLLNEGS